MNRNGILRLRAIAGVWMLAIGATPSAFAQRASDTGAPVYQRRAFESVADRRDKNDRHVSYNYYAPQVSASWFQRPYPYHLDYYRMRYGGSYAPYFGNLYGPPQVVTAPPYYGPYYGGYGVGGYGAGEYGPPATGYDGTYPPPKDYCPCEPAANNDAAE